MPKSLSAQVFQTLLEDSFTLEEFIKAVQESNELLEPEFPMISLNVVKILERSLFWNLPFVQFLMLVTPQSLGKSFGFRTKHGKRVDQVIGLLRYFDLKLGMSFAEIESAVASNIFKH